MQSNVSPNPQLCQCSTPFKLAVILATVSLLDMNEDSEAGEDFGSLIKGFVHHSSKILIPRILHLYSYHKAIS